MRVGPAQLVQQLVQVVANPLISLLGKPETASSRLTFAQAFNSLGTTIFPRVGSSLILGGLASVSAASLSGAALVTYRQEASQAIVHTYLGLAVALVGLTTGCAAPSVDRIEIRGDQYDNAFAAAQEGSQHPRVPRDFLLQLPVPDAVLRRRDETSAAVERAIAQQRSGAATLAALAARPPDGGSG